MSVADLFKSKTALIAERDEARADRDKFLRKISEFGVTMDRATETIQGLRVALAKANVKIVELSDSQGAEDRPIYDPAGQMVTSWPIDFDDISDTDHVYIRPLSDVLIKIPATTTITGNVNYAGWVPALKAEDLVIVHDADHWALAKVTDSWSRGGQRMVEVYKDTLSPRVP